MCKLPLVTEHRTVNFLFDGGLMQWEQYSYHFTWYTIHSIVFPPFSDQVSSALFFQYNTQLGPPFYILVDTNFINFSIKNKLDLFQSMMDCLYAKCKFYFVEIFRVLFFYRENTMIWTLVSRYTMYHRLCDGGIGKNGNQIPCSIKVWISSVVLPRIDVKGGKPDWIISFAELITLCVRSGFLCLMSLSERSILWFHSVLYWYLMFGFTG